MWGGLDAQGRRAWLSVALCAMTYQRRKRPADAPPGQVFTLDGRHITDIDGLYCALGEAVNGPGGYFGWNLDAVNDCLRGRFGATTPFTLRWLNSEAATSALISHDTADREGAADLEVLLQIFSEHDVDVLMC
ncbi:barstar family protein [Streptomyces sp. TRM66268-LWL]|uniref:Barstar family protein n=2 Tax=Streptomyces polyasparticus TaxID=2767826 RepID=A0ABR7SMR5_9ACTN|nr:barstar family protein [Streptomyces polyasparticus]